MMKKYRASKLTIKEVSINEEKAFLNENHYQRYFPSSWCKGLYDGNELLILMSFGKPRYTRKYDWELLRLCTKKGCIVHGGASKLLSAFRSHCVGSIISYCNRDKFAGTVYKALGFKSAGITKGYYYEKDGIRYHRSNFTRKKLEKLFPQYSRAEYTESEIMKLEGYTIVQDTVGQERFILDDTERKWYIYEIENNGYHYIGQHMYRETTDDNYFGSGTIIKRLNKKYGNGRKTILLDGIKTQEDANKYERCAIAVSKIAYKEKNVNIKSGGQQYYVSAARRAQSEESKQRMKEAAKERSWVYKTEEFKKRMSEATSGERNGMFGKHHSEESKRKLSETRRQRIEEGKITCKGHKWSTEDRKKLSERAKNSEKKKATMQSAEYKENMSKAIKGMKWWNNGLYCVRSKEQPEGFVPGRLKKAPGSFLLMKVHY